MLMHAFEKPVTDRFAAIYERTAKHIVSVDGPALDKTLPVPLVNPPTGTIQLQNDVPKDDKEKCKC